jgi:hypothetical protein
MTSPTESSLAIETRGLGKRFGVRSALDGVDLEVPPRGRWSGGRSSRAET